MHEFPQDGFAEFFTESLTDEEIQKIGGGSLVVLDDGSQAGWTDMMIPIESAPVDLSSVAPRTEPGDLNSYAQS